MMMPFEWDVRVFSKDHTVTAPTFTTRPATAGYTTLWGTTDLPFPSRGDVMTDEAWHLYIERLASQIAVALRGASPSNLVPAY